LIITHETYFAAALASRAVFFEKGKLLRFARRLAIFRPTAFLSGGDTPAGGRAHTTGTALLAGNRRTPPPAGTFAQERTYLLNLVLYPPFLQLEPFQSCR
jgi:hypothetical protein